jgi:hypothetical protein
VAHATDEQLAAYLGTAAPADADRLLDRASELIDSALVTASYAVDSTGAATDAQVLAALADATCAQVEFWLASDEEDDILGPVQGVSVGGMQVQFGAGSNRTAPIELAPRAARHLRSCSLIRF